MQKRLYKSNDNKIISGVCGGLAEYMNLDPTIVRLAYVLISVFTASFPGLIVYIIAACIMPEKPYDVQ